MSEVVPVAGPPALDQQHARPHDGWLAHHFDDLDQQHAAAELGMWLFLVTEFMFFGGLFTAYMVYHGWYGQDFATGSHTMHLVLGTINTAVLLTSSFSMAVAVHAAAQGHRTMLIAMLLATITLGAVFLGIKAYEYHAKFVEGLVPFIANSQFEMHANVGLETFLNLYFLMTGVHAAHMVIGIAILGTLVGAALRHRLPIQRSVLVHNVGLYWHFVDLVWVYLFPFFYLVTG
ncbi:MAG TPA: cytochrome c oxidase subunit 3 [Pirellulales bacterium]|jgi:cytochrome c oxidase subunit 3|nr:cytochrome c oxidase subunit 3 [Pirellulales bacterium]